MEASHWVMMTKPGLCHSMGSVGVFDTLPIMTFSCAEQCLFSLILIYRVGV